MTNEHSSLEKYTSHTLFSKGLRKGWYWLCVRGELETEQSATYWPQVILYYSSTSSSFCWAAQLGSWGPKSSVWSWFSLLQTATWTPTNWLQLTQTVCCTWLYNCLMLTCFLWALQLHWIQPVHRSRWYLDIFNWMHLLFTQVHLLIDSSVEGQYVTVCYNF